jgi:hypothetical protein
MFVLVFRKQDKVLFLISFLIPRSSSNIKLQRNDLLSNLRISPFSDASQLGGLTMEVVHLTFIREVTGSKLRRNTSYPD